MAHMLAPGEPAPWFHAQALDGNPRYAFDTAAGRWIVMLMMGSGTIEGAAAALATVREQRDLFDDDRTCFFGVTIDRTDVEQGRIAQALPGIRWFLDYDQAVSLKYGVIQSKGTVVTYTPQWLLLDPMLRVRSRAPLADGHRIIAEARHLSAQAMPLPTAPVLIVPDVLPPDICSRLIRMYDRHGGTESGFMREENGVTVARMDPDHKRRSDFTIDDDGLIGVLNRRIARTLTPMIQRAFQFEATRIERHIVACYDAKEGGHFRAHRDNTTKGTAHRRFACTINLDAESFEGGDLRFPEFGARTYRAPTGGAVVFSCSLLHEAQPVTKGRRYAFLPFLYDDRGAELRERNLAYVSPNIGGT